MQEPPSTLTVCHAINTLYNDPNPAEKEKASAFLNELQRSVYAWKIADDILHQKTDLEMCYFAAQTLKSKIQNSFSELPVGAHQSLRDSLITHLERVMAYDQAVIVTQLSIACTHLALQMASWKNPVDDLVAKFSTNFQSVAVLLEILAVFPEELEGRNLRLGANRRLEIVQMLKEVAPKVLQLLSSCVQSFGENETVLRKVFRCLGCWLTIDALPTSEPILISLINCGFQILSNHTTKSSVHEALSDAISNALVLVEDTSKHQLLAEVLFTGVYGLVNAYHSVVAEEDVDKAMNYCGIFVELGNSFLNPMVDFPNVGFGNLQNLDLLLICVSHPDFEVAEMTFNFWYRLSESLYKRDNESLNTVFEPYIQRLMIALCKHCQLDEDHEGIPDTDNDFTEFRAKVTETIKDAVFVIGSAKCFEQMYENLKNRGDATSWDIAEAALFVMCSVAKSILPEDNIVVPRVVESVLNMPDESTHIAVRYTSTQLLGELNDWIEKHPQYLDPVLNFLLKGLQHPSLATVAAASLQHICSSCRKQMASHFPGLLQILAAVDRISISNEAIEGILKGTALILAEMPFDKLTKGLRELCETQSKPLEELLKEEKNFLKEGTKTDPAVWLDRLSAIFRHTTPQVINGQVHPCQPVVQDVWPLLSACCNKYQSDQRIIERCCRCIRFVIRCVGKQSVILLEPLVKQIIDLYQHHQHSCFLYVGSILVDEFGSEPSCSHGLLDMLAAFCVPTFRILDRQNGLRNHPDTIDDLFRLCTRFLQWMPIMFLQNSQMTSIVHCAILACSLEHRDANASVMKFLRELIASGRATARETAMKLPENLQQQQQALAKDIIMEFGQDFVTAIIHAAVYALPSFLLVNLCDVLYELVLFDKLLLGRWLESALKCIPTKNNAGSVAATPNQLSDFHQNVISAEHVKVVCQSMKEFARLFR